MNTNALPVADQASASTLAPSPDAREGGVGPGRPSGFSPTMVEVLCSIIRRMGISDSGAAGRASLHPATVSRWKKAFPDFAILLQSAREEFRATQLELILGTAGTGSAGGWRAAAWLLERTFPEDYAPRARERAQFREDFDAAWAREEEGSVYGLPAGGVEEGAAGVSEAVVSAVALPLIADGAGLSRVALPPGFDEAGVPSADEVAPSKGEALHNLHNSAPSSRRAPAPRPQTPPSSETEFRSALPPSADEAAPSKGEALHNLHNSAPSSRRAPAPRPRTLPPSETEFRSTVRAQTEFGHEETRQETRFASSAR